MKVGMRGLEQTSQSSGKSQIDSTGGAESGAFQAANGSHDPDLQLINDHWPQLPDAIRAGIIAMVQAADPSKCECVARQTSEPNGR